MAKIATAQPKTAAQKSSQKSVSSEAAEIHTLAYQFFVERGYQHGHHEEDWLRAEAIVKNRKRS